MKKLVRDWWLPIVFLSLLLVAAFALRVFHLTILPVFADEAIYIRWSQIMANEPTLRFLPLSDGKQPLFMWILMFAVERFSDPLFIGRLLSVFAGLGTIIGLFTLTYLLFKNKWLSLVAAFFWAISPYAFFFDRMALVDSLLAMFILWTAIFSFLTAKTKRLDMAMLAGFTLGFAALTKSPAIFSLALILLTYGLVNLEAVWKVRLKTLIPLGLLLLVTFGIAFGMYNIQRLGPNFHMLTARTKDYVFPLSHVWTNPKDPFIFHFDRAIEWVRLMGPWPVLVLAGIGFGMNFKKKWQEKLFLLSWWLVPTLIQSELAKVFTARYELFTLPFLFILAATAFSLPKKATKIYSLVKYAGILLMGVFIIQALIFDYYLLTNPQQANLPRSERSGYLEEWTAGTGIKEVADYIRAEHLAKPDMEIVVGTEGFFGTLPDGLQMYLQNVPNVTVIGVGLDFGKVPDQLAVSYKSGTKTYLVANSSRINDSLEENFLAKGLRVVKSYKKADRPAENYKETVQYGIYDTFYLLEVVDPSNEKL